MAFGALLSGGPLPAAPLPPAKTLVAGASRPAGPPNVVYLLVDTLRADRVGAYGNPRATTPSLDRLAARGTLFQLAIAQVCVTVASVASIFTSMYPLSHGVLEPSRGLGEGPATLAEIFAANGYATAAFTAGGHLTPSFGLGRGFQTYKSMTYPGSFRVTVPQAVDWLDRRAPGPFFLFIHGYDVHSPYRVPLGYRELFDPGYRGQVDRLAFNFPTFIHHITDDSFDECGKGLLPGAVCNACDVGSLRRQVLPPPPAFPTGLPQSLPGETEGVQLPIGPAGISYRLPALERRLSAEDAAHIVAHYDGALAYSDLWLGLFIEELDRRGLSDNTVFVVSGDHGESLGEHGRYDHGYYLFDVNLHVPLIVAGPGVPAGQRVTGPVELIDVAPTLLELSGIAPCRGHQGRSLTAEIRATRDGAPLPPREAFSVIGNVASLRTPRWHYLRKQQGTADPARLGELYDLERDPGETASVLSRFPAEAAAFERRLLDRVEAAVPKVRERATSLRREDRAFLRTFGYW